MGMSIERAGMTATSATATGHEQLRQSPMAATLPRVARSPLGRSSRENSNAGCIGGKSGKNTSGASPIRRRMSILTQSPNTLKTANRPHPSRSPDPPRTSQSSKSSRSPRTPKTPRTEGRLYMPGPPDTSPCKLSIADLGLQKQCAELYAKLASTTADHEHLAEELSQKSKLVDELSQKVAHAERAIRVMDDTSRKNTDLHTQEMRYYKESVEELQRQNSRVAQALEQELLVAQTLAHEQEEKYQQLCRSYKALQSNLELEQNLKALLIDQIEYLTKEREILVQRSSPLRLPLLVSVDLDRRELVRIHASDFTQNSDDELENGDNDGNDDLHMGLNSEMTSNLNSNMNSDVDSNLNSDLDSDSDSDSDGSVHGTQLLSTYADLTGDHGFDASSPIKDKEDAHNLLDLSSNFRFPAPVPCNALQNPPQLAKPTKIPPPFSPPNPAEKAKSVKRQSLPAQLRLNSSFDDEFVLSPLKLTPQPNSSYFDVYSSAPSGNTRPNSAVKRRYSGTKANHSRYNSHDIVPIKVEFELPQEQLRSPDKEHLQQYLSSVAESEGNNNPIEDSDSAFMKLNGFSLASKRDSLMTDSSKQSSFISDTNVMSGDITKQEITKLKFELQSLKLHNEKLLSYIGFELQKQKKNIKKLSSKQNLRPKKTSHNFEYSDAKLIEKLKEMLIHKKRVLRSVSINPILSTKYTGRRNSLLFLPLVGLGATRSHTEDEDDFVFKSHFISSLRHNDCDDYGFLNHNGKHNLRILSGNSQEFSDMNGHQMIKKHKSQTFGNSSPRTILDLSSAEESFMLIDEEPELEDIEEDYVELNGEWESSSEKSMVCDVDYGKLNRFSQMKYLILGKELLKKPKQAEPMNMKYKFLTIAIGIAIVGLKLAAHPQQQLTGS